MTSAIPRLYLLLKIPVGKRQNLSENYPQFGHVPSEKKVRRTCPNPKKFTEYRFEGTPNYWRVRGTHMSGTRPGPRDHST
jgi:hypothetical protein